MFQYISHSLKNEIIELLFSKKRWSHTTFLILYLRMKVKQVQKSYFWWHGESGMPMRTVKSLNIRSDSGSERIRLITFTSIRR